MNCHMAAIINAHTTIIKRGYLQRTNIKHVQVFIYSENKGTPLNIHAYLSFSVYILK